MVHKKYDTRKNYKMNFNFIKITIVLLLITIIIQTHQTHQTTQELLRILAK